MHLKIHHHFLGIAQLTSILGVLFPVPRSSEKSPFAPLTWHNGFIIFVMSQKGSMYVCHIWIHIYHQYTPNVSIYRLYIPYMDPMGESWNTHVLCINFLSFPDCSRTDNWEVLLFKTLEKICASFSGSSSHWNLERAPELKGRELCRKQHHSLLINTASHPPAISGTAHKTTCIIQNISEANESGWSVALRTTSAMGFEPDGMWIEWIQVHFIHLGVSENRGGPYASLWEKWWSPMVNQRIYGYGTMG